MRIPIGSTLWVALLVAAACPAAVMAQAGLRLHGSNTIGQRLAPALVRGFAESRQYTLVEDRVVAPEERAIVLRDGEASIAVQVHAHGTGTGFASLRDGKADLWMASRPVTPTELAAAGSAGALDSPAQEHVIALDGLAIIVHPRNPMRTITVAQVRDVFAGRVRDWRELGGAPGTITLHARDDKSGTYDTFKSLVLGDVPLARDAQRFESTEALAQRVASDPRAIGFVGVAGIGAARPLAVSDTGTRALVPERLTLATEDYGLSRRLYLYSRPDASALATAFVEFALGPAGQSVVERIGFVSQDVVALALPPRTDVSAEYSELTAGARRLSVNFRFEPGSIYLDSKAMRDVARLVDFMRQAGPRREDLILIGFVDGNETNPYQALSLSNERVDYVALQLLAQGLGPRKVRGMGHSAPVSSDETATGRHRNRRVEVWIRRNDEAAGAGTVASQ